MTVSSPPSSRHPDADSAEADQDHHHHHQEEPRNDAAEESLDEDALLKYIIDAVPVVT